MCIPSGGSVIGVGVVNSVGVTMLVVGSGRSVSVKKREGERGGRVRGERVCIPSGGSVIGVG